MPWNEPGGNQQDPWNGKNRNTGGKNQVEDLLNQLNKKLTNLLNSGKKGSGGGNDDEGSNREPFNFRVILIVLAVLFAGWLFTGFYTVDARQQALVLRFGEHLKTVGPGLRWHLPTPIEKVELIDVAQVRSVQDRSTMLTTDENIIDLAVTVQYRVNSAEKYAFNVFMVDNQLDPTQGTVYQAMRGAARETVGRSNMDFILGDGREQIAIGIQTLLQNILNRYEAGLQVIQVNLTYAEAPEQVKDAFDDANRAREDANRFQNEAESYANRVVPESRGQGARLLEEANAYRDRIVARAEGDASRFSQLAKEYLNAPNITRERLYLDAMQEVLTDTRKVVVDSSNNFLYIPVDNDSSRSAAPPLPASMAPVLQQNESRTTTNGRTRNLSGQRESR